MLTLVMLPWGYGMWHFALHTITFMQFATSESSG